MTFTGVSVSIGRACGPPVPSPLNIADFVAT